VVETFAEVDLEAIKTFCEKKLIGF